jgi:hypothetical protein
MLFLQIEIDDENVTSTSAVLYESDLERRLEPILSTLTDKQQRLIDDLKQLRDLLKQVRLVYQFNTLSG